MNDTVAADDWFRSQAARQVGAQALPAPGTSPTDPVWSSVVGVLAYRLITIGRLLTVMAVLVLLTVAVLGAIGGPVTSWDSAADLVSLQGFVIGVLIATAALLRVVRSPRISEIGRWLAWVCLGLAVVGLPIAAGEPFHVEMGESIVLIGPAGPRFLVASVLISFAVALPSAQGWWARLASVGVIVAAGFGLLEAASYVFGADRISWGDSQIGLPPGSAIAITLMGTGVFFLRPDREPLASIVRAGPSQRLFWRTFSGLVIWMITCAVLIRGLTNLDAGWSLAVTYGWSALLVGSAALFVLRGQKIAREQTVNDGVQSQLRILASNTSDIVWIADPNGRCVWVSESLTDTLGCNPSEWVHRLGSELVAAPSQDELESATRIAKQEKRTVTVDLQYIARTGEPVWMSSRLRPLAHGPGEDDGTIHSLRDVDELVEFQESLQLSESRLRIALESSPVGTALLDKDRTITQVNRALASILEISAQGLQGRPIEEIFKREDELAISPNIVATAAGSDSGRSVFGVTTPTGKHRWCTYEIAELPSSVQDPQGGGFIGQVRDIPLKCSIARNLSGEPPMTA